MAKIAIYNVTNTLKRGGVETCLWEVAKKFDQWGHQVTVLGGQGPIRPSGNAGGITVNTFDFISRDRIVGLGSRFKKLGERLSFAKRALPALIAGKFDAIILGKPYDIPAALWARRGTGARVAYFSGGGEYFPGYGPLVRRLDYFCACSAHDCQEIERYCGVRPQANNYGVDTQTFAPLPADGEFRGKFLGQAGGPVMATAVRLVAFKGLDVGLKAMALLRNSFPDLKYVIAGEGPEKPKLSAMVQALDLERQVVFAGELDHGQLPRLYSLAQVAIFPSFMETFGIAVGEAMACGVPVVASRVGGIPEQVVEGAGFLVTPRDEKELADAIARLLTSGQRERMAATARAHAVSNLDWSRCAKKLLDGVLPPGK